MGLSFGLISLGSKSSQMLLEEAKKYFDEVDHIDLRKIEINLDNRESTVLYDGKPLGDYDCFYMKGSYKYSEILYGLSEIYKDKAFIPIEANAHIIAHNKFMTQLYLNTEKEIKMPSTYFTVQISETKSFLKTLNYPIILKFPTGTHGKGVIFAESYSSASSMVDALQVFKQPVVVQDYINIKSDIRVIVAGDRVVGAMRRNAKSGDIRANAHQGGGAEVFVVTPQIKQMSLKAAKKLNASVCAIDIIESDYGPQILEVNTSPGLQKITEVTRKNIAGEIASYLFEQTKRRKESIDKANTKDLMTGLGIQEIGSRDFEIDLNVKSGKIILPEFATKFSGFSEGEQLTLRIGKNKIELVKEDYEHD